MRPVLLHAVIAALLVGLPIAPAAAIDVAVTFDDLPGGRAEIAAVLDTLAKRHWQGVPGFVNGGQISSTNGADGQLRRWMAAGQRLGNHTFSHADLWAMSTEAYLADLRRNEAVLAQVAGEQLSWRLFRYPFLFEGRSPGEYRDIRSALQAQGYTVAQVTIDPYDWAWDDAFNRCRTAQDEAGVRAVQEGFIRDALAQLHWADNAAQAVFGRPIKHILLLHIRSLAAATLDPLLDAFVAAGVRFVPIEEALADPAYATDAAGIGPVGGTYLRQLMRAHPGRGTPVPPAHPMAAIDAFCALRATASASFYP